MLWLCSVVLVEPLILRDVDDDFALATELHFTGKFFDGGRVGLQVVDAAGQYGVLRVEPRNIGFDHVDFRLRPAHGEKPVRAKHVVNAQHQDQQSQQASPELAPERGKSVAGGSRSCRRRSR